MHSRVRVTDIHHACMHSHSNASATMVQFSTNLQLPSHSALNNVAGVVAMERQLWSTQLSRVPFSLSALASLPTLYFSRFVLPISTYHTAADFPTCVVPSVLRQTRMVSCLWISHLRTATQPDLHLSEGARRWFKRVASPFGFCAQVAVIWIIALSFTAFVKHGVQVPWTLVCVCPHAHP
jgi:hypothetical protein